MAKATSIDLTFTREKETAKTIRFEESGDADKHKVGKLYVKKSTVKSLGEPDELTVTIAAG